MCLPLCYPNQICQASFFAISVDDIAISYNDRTRQITSISAIHRGGKRYQITMFWYGINDEWRGGGGVILMPVKLNSPLRARLMHWLFITSSRNKQQQNYKRNLSDTIKYENCTLWWDEMAVLLCIFDRLLMAWLPIPLLNPRVKSISDRFDISWLKNTIGIMFNISSFFHNDITTNNIAEIYQTNVIDK